MKNIPLHKSNGSNGHGKLHFPLTFDLKVILETLHPEQQMQAYLRAILSRLEIPNAKWRSKLSAEGKYISITIEIVLKNEELMKELYAELKSVPGIKLAL